MGFLLTFLYFGIATFILVGICKISVVHDWLEDTFKEMD